ncbi:MAG: hypothetical protein AAF939_15765 [Planctomycetota bacterium]
MTAKFRHSVQAFLVLIVSLNNCGLSQAQTAFRWNLEQGEEFEVTLFQTTNSKTRVESRETVLNSSNTIVMNWTVAEVVDGVYKLEQELRQIQLQVGDPAVPNQAVEYDTGLAEQKVSKVSRKLRKQILPLIGLKFNVSMTDLGEITDVELPDETAEVINQLPGTLAIRKLFSETGLRQVLGSASIVLPSEELQPGEKWESRQELNLAFGDFVRIREFEYKGERKIDDNRFAEFKLTSRIENKDADAGKDAGSGGVKKSIPSGTLKSFQGSGKMMLGLDSGYFVSSSVETQVDTESPYREKTILTELISRVEISIKKL